MPHLSVAEILKRVQRIQIVANRAAGDMFAGHYRSVFRGRGMEFEEVREYQPGDDIRSIDWNVTARSDSCFIKRFREERELTVMFLVDVSASGVFGSQRQAKLDLVVEMAALLMFAALKNNDKVGMITFCEQVEEFLPARKGKSHVLHLIRQLVDAQPVPRPTDLTTALDFLNRVQKRRAVVFLISDFLTDVSRRVLGAGGRRHDLTAITVTDPRELDLPDVGLLRLQDPETGEIAELDTGRRSVREAFHRQSLQRREATTRILRQVGIDQLVVDTHGDYLSDLRKFFDMREHRFR
jgi:uncharacterized protein (DUF58 family)